jgi:hypothetical protein
MTVIHPTSSQQAVNRHGDGGAVPRAASAAWTERLVAVVSLLLAAAAALKTYAFVAEPWRSSAVLLSAQVLAECVLAAWLVSHYRPRVARIVAIGCFTVFAAVALWMRLRGASSCGCFGPLPVQPAIILVIDVCLVVVLLPTAGRCAANAAPSRRSGRLTTILLATCVIFLGAIIWSSARTRASLRRPGASAGAAEPTTASVVAADKLVADLGYIEPGGRRTIRYLVPNASEHDAKVVNVVAECACTRLTKQSSVIPAKGTAAFEMIFDAPSEVMRYAKRVVLYTDREQRSTIALELRARIGLPLRAEPSSVTVGASATASTAPTVELTNDGEVPVTLQGVTCDAPGYSVELLEKTVKPGCTVTISIVVDRERIDLRRKEARVRISTDAATQQDVHILICQR